ncbi:unnamed protein product [Prunus armeniaca]
MGFRDLELFNKALVAKQCWRLLTNEQSMIHKVLKARYFPNCNFLAAGKGRASSYVWRSLIWGRELLLSGLRKRTGDGQDTLVYGDAWIPRPNSFRPISPQVLDQESKKLHDQPNSLLHHRYHTPPFLAELVPLKPPHFPLRFLTSPSLDPHAWSPESMSRPRQGKASQVRAWQGHGKACQGHDKASKGLASQGMM